VNILRRLIFVAYFFFDYRRHRILVNFGSPKLQIHKYIFNN